jgi:hypothetical protein
MENILSGPAVGCIQSLSWRAGAQPLRVPSMEDILEAVLQYWCSLLSPDSTAVHSSRIHHFNYILFIV